ncbi:hypothetical protein RND81_11G108400 [Saponaria officinalis]|uniref:Nucleoplasmin-like domain-containing protein n=1 Tax=Saponaria officinalis TaxID=3572 RepID=A0AAW1HKH0_SAPOF
MASSMQFWGVEVKPKVPCQVNLEDASFIHVSQATLSDIKKDIETVTIHAKVGDKKWVLGTLNQKTPRLSFDLVFDEDFELSHNWKNGSIHFLGYQADMDDDEMIYSSSDEEDVPVPILKEEAAKAAAGKPKVDNKPKPETEDDSDEDDSTEDDSDDSEDDDDEVMAMANSDEDSDEDDSEDSEDDTPAKAKNGVKRPNADSKTPPQSKKAKIATPQKTDSKKGVVHPATPHPMKKGGQQTPGGSKSPKSGGGKFQKSGGNSVPSGPSKK